MRRNCEEFVQDLICEKILGNNYRWFFLRVYKKLYKHCTEKNDRRKWSFLMVDEIHKAMNNNSLRCTIASELSHHCKWHIELTGMPFGRNPSGLWAQAYIVDGRKALLDNYYFFEKVFGKKEHNYFSNHDEYPFDTDKLDILRGKIAHMVLSCKLLNRSESEKRKIRNITN